MSRQMLPTALRSVGFVIALVAVVHVVLGPQADIVLGSQMSDLSASDPSVDSQNRFYGAAFLLFGAIMIHCASDLHRYRTVLSIAFGVFFLAGLARIVSIAVVGWPAWPIVGLLVVELALPPGLLLWLWRDIANKSDRV